MTERRFDDLVDQCDRLVYTICYQLVRDHHTAQDLAQETFLSAYTHRDTCPEDNPNAWLARIAANKAKDYLRSAYHRRVVALAVDAMPEDRGSLYTTGRRPEDLVAEQETAGEIDAEVLALRPPYAEVATLYFLCDRSVDEISRRLGRPCQTVHTQLFRAKRMLRKALTGRGLRAAEPCAATA